MERVPSGCHPPEDSLLNKEVSEVEGEPLGHLGPALLAENSEC